MGWRRGEHRCARLSNGRRRWRALSFVCMGVPRLQDATGVQGDLAHTPFVHVLLSLHERGASGTLILSPDWEGLEADGRCRVAIERGHPVKGLFDFPATELLEGLLGCVERRDSYGFYPGEDLTVGLPGVLEGRPDLWRVASVLVERGFREEAIAEVLGRAGAKPLCLTSRCDEARLPLGAEGRWVLDALSWRPTAVSELVKKVGTGLNEFRVRRVCYVLLITRAAEVAPELLSDLPPRLDAPTVVAATGLIEAALAPPTLAQDDAPPPGSARIPDSASIPGSASISGSASIPDNGTTEPLPRSSLTPNSIDSIADDLTAVVRLAGELDDESDDDFDWNQQTFVYSGDPAELFEASHEVEVALDDARGEDRDPPDIAEAFREVLADLPELGSVEIAVEAAPASAPPSDLEGGELEGWELEDSGEAEGAQEALDSLTQRADGGRPSTGPRRKRTFEPFAVPEGLGAESERALFAEAQTLMSQQKWHEAIPRLRRCVAHNSRDARYFAAAAMCMHRIFSVRGSPAEVNWRIFRVADRAVSLDGHNDDAHYIRGLALRRLGRTKEALLEFEHAAWLNPEHIDAKREVVIAERRAEKERRPSFIDRLLALAGR